MDTEHSDNVSTNPLAVIKGGNPILKPGSGELQEQQQQQLLADSQPRHLFVVFENNISNIFEKSQEKEMTQIFCDKTGK